MDNKALIEFLLGHELAGRYLIDKVIGESTLGVKFTAYDSTRDETVAVQVFQPNIFDEPKKHERFMKETRISCKLSHPNLVNVYDVHLDGEIQFTTMELVTGENLRTYLDKNSEGLPVEKAMNIATTVADALSYTHEFTLHTDIHPQNIWLQDNGKIKLQDSTTARILTRKEQAQAAAATGSAKYLAPEQEVEGGKLDERTDQYSLAVVLYEMLVGHIPSGNYEPLDKTGKDIPLPLARAVDKALSSNPENRYTNISSFIQAASKKRITIPSIDKMATKRWKKRLGIAIGILLLAGIFFSKPVQNFGSKTMQSAKEVYGKAAKVGEVVVTIGETFGLIEQTEEKKTAIKKQNRKKSVSKPYAKNSKQEAKVAAKAKPIVRGGNYEGRATRAKVKWGYYTRKYKISYSGTQQMSREMGEAKELKKQGSKNSANKMYKRLLEKYLSLVSRVDDLIEQSEQLKADIQKVKDKAAHFEAEITKLPKEIESAINSYENLLSRALISEAKRQLISGEAALVRLEAKVMRNGKVWYAKQLKIALPAMVSISGGYFTMGNNGKIAAKDEQPAHKVKVKPFRMSKHEITFAQYDAYSKIADKKLINDTDFGRGKHPVIHVSWHDATAYSKWLSKVTGKRFRLPSEAEWEYAAKAGSKSDFYWGNKVGRKKANCDGCGSKWDNKSTAPVGSFSPNKFGLYDMHGNVYEWTADCWNINYANAPKSGKAWLKGKCGSRVIRGGSYTNEPKSMRSSNRFRINADFDKTFVGFRVASN